MNQKLIDWHLERAAEEMTWANRLQARRYAESMEECRYEAGMHIASANALIETRIQIGPLDV